MGGSEEAMMNESDLRNDLWSGGVLLLLGGAYLAIDLRYPLDSLANPGPGLFPLAAGMLLVTLALLQLAQAGGTLLSLGRAVASRPSTDDPGGTAEDSQAGRRPVLMLAILVVYLLVVSWIGFLTSTFLLVVICSKLMGSRGWSGPVALAAGLALACYLLFSVWLRVPLPAGRLL
jgi:hypothetical protein